MKQLILLASILLATIATTFAQSDLTLTINGIKNTKGTVRIAIFNKADGFPSDSKKAYKTLFVKSSLGNISTTIQSLSYGKYGIVVFYDENNNNEFDTNFMGIPKEGSGATNAVEKGRSKPKYENAVFTFSENNKTVSIKLFY
jgi:uncharacterized protein (DUF2141 family)